MKICYLLKTFPKVSETFVLQEILALEREGYSLHIVSLQQPTDDRFHDEVGQVEARVDYLDHYTLKSRHWLSDLLTSLMKNPSGTFKAIALLLKQEISS